MAEWLEGRIVALSPHPDDVVLSLGAAIAGSVRRGATVEVLTVFAGDPDAEQPAGKWDARSGFRTEGEAARARRAEDVDAFSILGASVAWLPLGDKQYHREVGENEVWPAIARAVARADAVLIPGFPLIHRDHAWLCDLLMRRGLPCARMGLYVEQPYAYHLRKAHPRPTVPERVAAIAAPWSRLAARGNDRFAKRQAIRAYRSQRDNLGMSKGVVSRLDRMLWHELMHGGEAVAWLTEGPSER